MTDFFELDLDGRFAVARARLEPIATQLGGAITLEDTHGLATLASADCDGMFVTIRARAPGSGRPVTVLGCLVDLAHEVGSFQITGASSVSLAVEVDNRLGRLRFVQQAPDGESLDPDTHELLSGSMYVSDLAADERAWMKRRLERLPGLLDPVDRFLQRYDGYSLDILHTVVESTLAFLDDDDDEWATNIRDIPGRIEMLDRIAALIETVPMAGFSTCRFCGGRFMPGPSAVCPHCGGAL